MAGLDSIMWRGTIKWAELVAAAEYVLAHWNTVTHFVSNTDKREHIWTARHETSSQPFMLFSEDSLRGSLPRNGNPLSLLLMIGMTHARPDCFDVTFGNGQKLDLMRFDPADLANLIPQATHPAHKKLATMAVALSPMPPPVVVPK